MVLTDAPSPVAIAEQIAASDHPEDGAVAEIITDAQFAEFSRRWISAVFPHPADGGLLSSIGATCHLLTLPQRHWD
jgi:hypothetical protein